MITPANPYWKDGALVGKMMKWAKLADVVAFAYATAGILAHAQDGGVGDWTIAYYNWILPSSAPAMFFYSFMIQSANPITAAARDQAAYTELVLIEQKRATLDNKRMDLNEKKQRRQLRKHVFSKKMVALWKESDSRRVKNALIKSAQVDMPLLLKEVNVTVEAKDGIIAKYSNYQSKQLTAKSNGRASLN